MSGPRQTANLNGGERCTACGHTSPSVLFVMGQIEQRTLYIHTYTNLNILRCQIISSIIHSIPHNACQLSGDLNTTGYESMWNGNEKLPFDVPCLFSF